MQWAFNLDRGRPEIEIHNLGIQSTADGTLVRPGLPVPATAQNVFEITGTAGNERISDITGSVSDLTGVRGIYFTAARWDIAAEEWRWLDGVAGSGFTLTGANWLDDYGNLTPAGIANARWRDLPGPGDADEPPRHFVDWAIPGSLFSTPGQYKIHVRATDWSLDRLGEPAGNPHNLGGVSRIFFVDEGAPRFLAYDDGWDYVEDGDAGSAEFFAINWNNITDDTAFALMPEYRRVFSAEAFTDNADIVFRLRGRLRDANLRELTATIGTEGMPNLVTAAAVAGEDGSADSDGNAVPFQDRLSLEQARVGDDPDGAIVPGEWIWTLNLLERDVRSLLIQNGHAGIRRLVSLFATDVANHRSAQVQWAFNLDGEGPTIYIHNLQRAALEFTVNGSANPVPAAPGTHVPPGIVRNVFAAGTAITGSASDYTGVRQVYFTAARWCYADNAWHWLDGDTGGNFEPRTGWFNDATGNLTDYGVAYASWRALLDSTESRPSLEWEIPPDLFEEQGRYMVFVRATDWSLARSISTGGNLTEPVGGFGYHFFVDSGPQEIRWGARGGDGVVVIDNRQFFNDTALANDGFVFYAGDENTITYLSASVMNAAGTDVVPGSSVSITVGPPAGSADPDLALNWWAAGPNNHWGTGLRRVTLRPAFPGDAPDNVQFTLEVTLQDSAGNESYIGHTRTFTRINQAPVINVRSVTTRPAQTITDANLAAGIINIGLAGNVTIRGTADAGSPILASGVSYALLRPGQAVSAYDVEWIQGGDQPSRWMGGPNDEVEIMRMEPNPSLTWTIEIRNTREIIDHAPGFVQAHTVVDTAPGPNQVARDTLSWDGDPLELDSTVFLARLAVEVEDESGNAAPRVFNLWIYPEGDRPRVTILSPAPVGYDVDDEPNDLDEARRGNLLSGRFTLTGRAEDNEDISDVFFRVLRLNDDGTLGAPFTDLFIPEFAVDPNTGEWGQVSGSAGQNPIPIIPGGETVASPGWYQASGGGRRDVVWSVPINACGRLDYEGAGGERAIVIQVVARDAEGGMHSRITYVSTVHAYVVSGAPTFGEIELTLVDAMGIPRDGSPDEVHIGRRSGTVELTFDVSVLEGRELSSIRFQRTDPATLRGTGPMIDLVGTVENRLLADGVTWLLGAGISEIEVTTPYPDYSDNPRARRITIEIDAAALAGMFDNRALRFPLHITASDNSSPVLTARAADLYLHIDNTPPFARMELNPSIAGTSATLGGSASPWPGIVREDVGRMDRVIVWFEHLPGRAPAGVADNGIAWHWSGVGTRPTFRRGDPVDVTRPDGTTGTVQLPFIPTGTAANTQQDISYAIVIDINDPLGHGMRHGHRLATGWTMGGLGQMWNFTFNSRLLPSGPLNMHFVAFDYAGNASFHTQQVTVMNDAPLILDVQIATDLRGGDALNNALNTGIDNATGTSNIAVGRDGIFSRFVVAIPDEAIDFGSPSDEERSLRRGISLRRRPPTQAGLLGVGVVQDAGAHQGIAEQGARYHFGDFTIRNNFLAFGIQTAQPPGAVGGRTFRVQHVRPETGANAVRPASQIEAGNAYIVEYSPATVDWSAVGAQRRVNTGYVFVAIADGSALFDAGAATVRRLDPVYGTDLTHTFGDAAEDAPVLSQPDRDLAVRAEFAFRGNAFGTGENQIRDYVHAIVPPATALPVWRDKYALFLVSVFDGPEDDLFGDHTLISVRVNNDDRTPPFAQLYDLNPAAIGHTLAAAGANPDAPATAVQTVIRPAGIGENRTMGSLWRHNLHGNLSRPGNIEPRRIITPVLAAHPNYINYWHSLTPAEMGEVDGDSERVNRTAFFDVDTVSGRVILRGYAEDDQRISGISLVFTEVAGVPVGSSANLLSATVPILVSSDPTGPMPDLNGAPPQTGMLAVADDARATGNVFFTDTVDLHRHRVEWAFVWDTANVPGNFMAGNLTVRVIATNAPAAQSPLILASANTTIETVRAGAPVTARTDTRMRNFGFPAGMFVYNQIQINVRPYITGFARNTAFNNTRSLQGRRAFYRGGVAGQDDETAVVTGFNLGFAASGFEGSATNIFLPRVSTNNPGVAAGVVATPGTFGLSSSSPLLYRQFTVPQDARTGDGIVRLNVVLPTGRPGAADAARTFQAVNTGEERRTNWAWSGTGDNAGVTNGVWWVQPWNVERSAAAGEIASALWDNVPRVHIWQSNNATSDANQGSFPASRTTWEGSLFGTSMAINPATGTLHASHNEGGGTGLGGIDGPNVGITIISTNELASRTINTTTAGSAFDQAEFRVAMSWVDPIMNSDITVDAQGRPWAVSSLIGRASGDQHWRGLGGIWAHGPGGQRMDWTTFAGTASNTFNNRMYNIESTWYNAGNQDTFGWGDASAARQSVGGWGGGTGAVGTAMMGDFGQTDQFSNPRVATFWDGTTMHTHVVYFDNKDGSIKYRYIREWGASPNATDHGVLGTGGAPAAATSNAVVRGWVNLDGGFDADDTVPVRYVFPFRNAEFDGPAGAILATGIAVNERVVNHSGRDPQTHPSGPRTRTRGSIIAGEHNDIAVTSQGHPVVAYFDATNNRLRMAISNSRTPFVAASWDIVDDVLRRGTAVDPRSFGTGQYVSIAIDTRRTFAAATGPTLVAGTIASATSGWNDVHISAWNDNFNSLVYIRGRVNSTAANGYRWHFEDARVIDSVGSVGRRSNISLDEYGNPWIAYLDGSFVGGREGVKVAFLNRNAAGNHRNEFGRRQYDYLGDPMIGWETMHVPARFPVVDHQDFVQASQLGMENFPTRNGPQFTTETMPANRWWRGAVGFLSNDLFRIAYWVE